MSPYLKSKAKFLQIILFLFLPFLHVSTTIIFQPIATMFLQQCNYPLESALTNANNHLIVTISSWFLLSLCFTWVPCGLWHYYLFSPFTDSLLPWHWFLLTMTITSSEYIYCQSSLFADSIFMNFLTQKFFVTSNQCMQCFCRYEKSSENIELSYLHGCSQLSSKKVMFCLLSDCIL